MRKNVLKNKKNLKKIFFYRQFFIIGSILLFTIQTLSQEIANSTTDNPNVDNHFINCTIEGKIYYDYDCTNEFGRFFNWLGLGLFISILIFFICLSCCVASLCRDSCSNDNDEPKLVIRQFPNYSTLSE